MREGPPRAAREKPAPADAAADTQALKGKREWNAAQRKGPAARFRAGGLRTEGGRSSKKEELSRA